MLPDKDIARLPLLDAPEPVVLRGSQYDMSAAKRGDPASCVFANTCHRADLEAYVLRTITWVVTTATKHILDYNRAMSGEDRVAGIKAGDPIRIRYKNDSRLREQIRLWDDEGREFIPGEFALLPHFESTASGRPLVTGGSTARPSSTGASGAGARSGGGTATLTLGLSRSGLERKPPQKMRMALARAK